MLRFTPSLPIAPVVLASCSVMVAVAPLGAATVDAKRSFDLPRGDAATTLRQFAATAGRSLVFVTDKVRGETTNPVRGEFTPREALDRMLAGSALEPAQDAATGALVVSRKRLAEAATRTGEVRPISDPQPKSITKTQPMKSPRSLLAALLGLIIGSSPAAFSAEASSAAVAPIQTGGITGTVFNRATRQNLSNAEVTLAGSSRVVYTTTNGGFELSQVPPGNARVVVTYPGLDAKEISVVVIAGQRANQEIGLESGTYDSLLKLDKFVVNGEREGRAAALSKQKRAENIVSVIDSGEFPNVASGNIGDFLRNVPGIVIDYAGSDPRAIRVRGMDPRMGAVTVDGMRGANANGSGTSRQYDLDVMSLQNIESIEVTKSPTAEQSADMGGGQVNLVTKSALALKGRHISYSLNVNSNSNDWSPLEKTTGPNQSAKENNKLFLGGTLSLTDSFLNSRLGVAINASDYQRYGAQRTFSTKWAGTSFPREDVLGAIPRGLDYEINPSLTNRKSFAVNLDYRLDDHTSVYLKTMVNTSKLFQLGRLAGLYSGVNASTNPATISNYVLPGADDKSATMIGDLNASLDTARGSTNGNSPRARALAGNYLNKQGTGTNFSAGVKHEFSSWKIDYAAGVSQATNKYDSEFGGKGTFGSAEFHLRGISYRIDTPANGTMPVMTQLAGPSILDLGNYVSRSLSTDQTTNSNIGTFRVTTDSRTGRDKFITYVGNARYDFATIVPVYVKAGLSYRHQHRDTATPNQRAWFYVGPDGISGTPDDSQNLGRFQDFSLEKHAFGYANVVPSLSKIYEYYQSNTQAFQEDKYMNIRNAAANNRTFEEKISAAYLMSGIKLGKLGVNLGLRGERTANEGEGPVTDVKAAIGITDRLAQARAIYGSKRIRRESNYTNLFPNAQLRYDFAPDLVARASYSETVGRQDIGNLMPGANISDGSPVVVSVNNTELKPNFMKNYDLGIEYYLKPVGIISVGIFYKTISNYTRSFDEAIVANGNYNIEGINLNDYVGGILRQQQNASDGEVKGLELSYSQQLSAYSKLLQGVGVFANYTTQKAEGKFGGTLNITGPLDNYLPKTFNAGFTYRRSRLNLSLTYNWRASYYFSFGGAGFDAKKGTYDVDVSYEVLAGHSLFLQVSNLTNEKNRSLFVHDYRTERIREFGATLNFGIRGRF